MNATKITLNKIQIYTKGFYKVENINAIQSSKIKQN